MSSISTGSLGKFKATGMDMTTDAVTGIDVKQVGKLVILDRRPAAIAVFLESGDLRAVKQATATCVQIKTTTKSGETRQRVMLVTTAHTINVPTPHLDPDLGYGDIPRFGQRLDPNMADDIEYFKVRAIVVFGDLGQGTEKETNRLLFAWEITEDPVGGETQYLKEGVHYATCKGFNYFKPYRKQNNFALIDLSRANLLSPHPSHPTTSAVARVIADRHDILKNAHIFFGVLKLNKEAAGGRMRRLDLTHDAPLYVIGFPHIYVNENSSWDVQRNKFMHDRHELLKRKVMVIYGLKARPRWEGAIQKDRDDGSQKVIEWRKTTKNKQIEHWKMPPLEREYKDTSVVPKLDTVVQKVCSRMGWNVQRAWWPKKPVEEREPVEVGEHLLLAQGYPSLVEKRMLRLLRDGYFSGATWVLAGPNRFSGMIRTEEEQKDQEVDEDETEALGFHIGGPMGLANTEYSSGVISETAKVTGGLKDKPDDLYVCRRFDVTFIETAENMASEMPFNQ